MGGLVCAIPHRAILRFERVPSAPVQAKRFDEQMRELYANPVIATAVATETQRGEEACAVLRKSQFTHDDRQVLLAIIDSLYYEHEPAGS